MGERNYEIKSGELFIEIDGERMPLCPINGFTLTEPAQELDLTKGIVRIAPETEITGTIYNRHRRMSRKRYIKKLMSHGVPRNDARECAKIISEGGISYFTGYLLYIL